MDPTIPTPTVSSTVTSSSVSAPPPPSTPLQLLEVSLISAQDLAPVSKSMRTYAIAWINPTRKLTTRTDQHGHTHPTWNDKFTFRMDNKTLVSEDAAITVEIYMASWFRDVLIGTVRVLISDLLSPPSGIPLQNLPKNMRFIALQVRRPSGTPQGILNMGVALLDSTMRSMPLQYYVSNSPDADDFRTEIEKKVNALNLKTEYDDDQEDGRKELDKKIHLWRSLSAGSELNNEEFPLKNGSVCNGSMVNGSMVNGSELCSDIGPSASIVAAELAQKFQPLPPVKPPANQQMKLQRNEDTGSSILEDLTIEEAQAKGYSIRTTKERWRKEISNMIEDCDESEISMNNSRHSRRKSDGGLFSCFGNAYGIEVTIVCGASNKPNNSMSRRKIKPNSETNSA